ncbi:hypothetical protein [Streptomyces sp. NPDC048639]|uniref:hypothetical protein n=1 Tax=Streptomyces sp. NPDC048639 TaxID=3365581 RepID=UPI003717CAD2
MYLKTPSRAGTALLTGTLALGMLVGAAACSGSEDPHGGTPASSPPKKLTAFEKRQVELVDSVLRNPDPEGVFADEERVGLKVGARRQGTMRGAYDAKVKPGQSVKVDVACTGGGKVTLAVDGGGRTETAQTRCPDDGSWPQPFVFTVQRNRVKITADAHGTKGAMGFAVQGIRDDAATARELLLADRAHAVLPDPEDEDDVSGLGTAWGSLREGIPGSIVDVKKGQLITVYGACVGKGTMTISGASGTAKAAERIPCASEVGTGSFRLTAADSTLRVMLDRDRGASGGATYSIRTPK